jgi:hypothetical protein
MRNRGLRPGPRERHTIARERHNAGADQAFRGPKSDLWESPSGSIPLTLARNP